MFQPASSKDEINVSSLACRKQHAIVGECCAGENDGRLTGEILQRLKTK
jgi:hypothetical protein